MFKIFGFTVFNSSEYSDILKRIDELGKGADAMFFESENLKKQKAYEIGLFVDSLADTEEALRRSRKNVQMFKNMARHRLDVILTLQSVLLKYAHEYDSTRGLWCTDKVPSPEMKKKYSMFQLD